MRKLSLQQQTLRWCNLGLQLLRAVLEKDTVAFRGRFFDVSAASVGTRPPVPLDIWLGGSAPAAFR